jgi:methyltransferase (TIGR00027 family)
MGRALAHGRTRVTRFSDPTALALLPDDERVKVEHLRAGIEPKTFGARMRVRRLQALERLMVARTVFIDDALRAAAAPQVVILGAGLDGRAWRMPELQEALVFEVDHPDTQREKRLRTQRASLTATAREVRFVPVDFTRDSLDAALASAGHDTTVPTTWIWEGVVMYLTLADVEASLRVIAARSAARSALAVAYHSPAMSLLFIGLLVRRLGEPLRSSFTAERMQALLAEHGFRVTRDDDIPSIARALEDDLRDLRGFMKHNRIAIAVRDLARSGPDRKPS